MPDKFNLSDIRESHLVAIENRMPYVSAVEESRAKAPEKHARSPYTDLSKKMSIQSSSPQHSK